MVDPMNALLAAAVVAVILALLLWPGRGVVPRWQRARRMTVRVLSEDALKYIHKSEMKGRPPILEGIAGAAQISLDEAGELVARLEAQGLLTIRGADLHLTPGGRDYALHVIRTHRLWERYLAEKTGYAEEEWHERAEQQEHFLSRSETDRLSLKLGNPTHDPHGDPIPTGRGEMIPHGGKPLVSMPLDTPLRIVHIEDEPPTFYAQLVAIGLHPGMTVRILENTPERVRFWGFGEEHVLAPRLAANISVTVVPEVHLEDEQNLVRLADLKPGEKGEVLEVSHACRGQERRRFMDLGILPGTQIEVEMRSPSGDPTAYRVRGTVIALRREQANMINMASPEESRL